MNYYHILPNSPVGDCAVLIEEGHYYFSEDVSSCRNGSLVLEIDSYEYHSALFFLHPFVFVTDALKEVFEQSKLYNFQYQKIDVFIAGPNLMDTNPNHGYTKTDFWRLIVDDNHATMYESKLVVSEVLLDFLITQGAFCYSISGGQYGKEFEYINNVFKVRGSIIEYFDKHYQSDCEYIRKQELLLIEMSKKPDI